jgi:hypothetical protein
MERRTRWVEKEAGEEERKSEEESGVGGWEEEEMGGWEEAEMCGWKTEMARWEEAEMLDG